MKYKGDKKYFQVTYFEESSGEYRIARIKAYNSKEAEEVAFSLFGNVFKVEYER